MARCRLCGRESPLVSSKLGVCRKCLVERPVEALRIARRAHVEWRRLHGLPPAPPRARDGLPCRICVNECRIPRGGRGYCGIWVNRGGVLEPLAGRRRLAVYTYLDPLPTNCVATPVCPATGHGYPVYTDRPGPEYGYYNLAVFLAGCPLDCLFCQNWEHKTMISGGVLEPRYVATVEDLVERALDPRIRCVSFFGGDPTPHLPMLIEASRKILEEAEKRGQRFKRICWETDGLAHPSLVKAMADLSLRSGGIVKIDWKAWTPSVYEALTGVDGARAVERLKENTRLLARLAGERREPPLLVVSVLLVPGYVTPGEVEKIASYLASLDPSTPMVLLAFHPDHLMKDLPPTSRDHALKALRAARRAGIRRVFLGNEWLLGDYYTCSEE